MLTSIKPEVVHRNNFNLLRLLFSLLVIVEHSFKLGSFDHRSGGFDLFISKIPFGEIAVDGFFLLSGYLIVKSWLMKPKIWEFLRNRLLRIYPGFVVASLFCAIVVGPLGANPKQYFDQFAVATYGKSLIFLLMPALPPVFAGSPYPVINGSMWTISYEFKCYLGVLFLGVLGAIRIRLTWLVATIAIFLLLLLQTTGHDMGWSSPIIRLSSCFFAGGCFFLYREVALLNGPNAIGATVLAVISFMYWPAAEVLFSAVGGFIFFYIGLKHLPSINEFNRLPDISYGVYLYAWPVQKLLAWQYPSMSAWTLLWLSSITTIVLGTLSWYGVEKPFMNLKRRSVRGITSKN